MKISVNLKTPFIATPIDIICNTHGKKKFTAKRKHTPIYRNLFAIKIPHSKNGFRHSQVVSTGDLNSDVRV